jgi:hypothetical protein
LERINRQFANGREQFTKFGEVSGWHVLWVDLYACSIACVDFSVPCQPLPGVGMTDP